MGLRSIRSVAAIVLILLNGQFASAQTTTRVSVNAAGFESNGSAGAVDMTPDGRFIAFYSAATNLTPEATSGVFWRDLVAGVTHFVAPGANGPVTISDDGQGLELRLDPWHGAASCGTFTAAALPAGASIDARSGVLAWQPAAGVGGTHDIAVTRTSCGGVREQFTVRIVFDTR